TAGGDGPAQERASGGGCHAPVLGGNPHRHQHWRAIHTRPIPRTQMRVHPSARARERTYFDDVSLAKTKTAAIAIAIGTAALAAQAAGAKPSPEGNSHRAPDQDGGFFLG